MSISYHRIVDAGKKAAKTYGTKLFLFLFLSISVPMNPFPLYRFAFHFFFYLSLYVSKYVTIVLIIYHLAIVHAARIFDDSIRARDRKRTSKQSTAEQNLFLPILNLCASKEASWEMHEFAKSHSMATLVV